MSLIYFLYKAGCYIYSNKRLVKELEITIDEMRELKTIILLNIQEKNNKNKEYRSSWKKNNRRDEDGLTSRELAKQDKIKNIKELLDSGKKQTEIVKTLNISKGLVSRYAKEIKNESELVIRHSA